MKFNYYKSVLTGLVVTLLLSLSNVLLAQEAEIFSLINERLGYMEDVALYKSQNNLAVEDIAREKIVVESAVSAAEEIGLAGPSIESFFIAQIEVAKAIQYRSIADWISAPANRTAPDLITEIRPALTSLGNAIVTALFDYLSTGKFIEERHRDLFNRSVTINHVSVADRAQLFESLLQVRTRN